MLALPPVNRRFVVPLGVLLGGSLFAAVRLPGLGIGLSNALIAIGGLALWGLYRPDLRPYRRRVGIVLAALVLVWCWSWVSSLAGPLPGVGVRSCIKGAIYLVALMGALALVADPRRARGVQVGILTFLTVLALFGVLEAIDPDSLPFRVLRSADSLSIAPRIASLLPWPNQFGAAMVLALVTTELLSRDGALHPGVRWPLRLLFVVQIAQSGSRNSWMLLAAALLLLSIRRVSPWSRVVAIGVLFAVIAVTLPVPARQLGLRSGSWIPAANEIIDEPMGWSPALAPAALSLSLRQQLWREALLEIPAHPVSGLGPNVFQACVGPRIMQETGFNTHSLVLEVWVGLGTVGLVLVGCALALAVRQRPPRRVGAEPGAAELPLVVLVLSQGIDCFTQDPTMVVLMVLAAAFAWFRAEPS